MKHTFSPINEEVQIYCRSVLLQTLPGQIPSRPKRAYFLAIARSPPTMSSYQFILRTTLMFASVLDSIRSKALLDAKLSSEVIVK